MKKAIALSLIVATSSAGARDWIDDAAEGTGRLVKPFTDDFARRIVERTSWGQQLKKSQRKGRIEYSSEEPLKLQKSLRDCTKTPNVIDEAVLECMKGN